MVPDKRQKQKLENYLQYLNKSPLLLYIENVSFTIRLYSIIETQNFKHDYLKIYFIVRMR